MAPVFASRRALSVFETLVGPGRCLENDVAAALQAGRCYGGAESVWAHLGDADALLVADTSALTGRECWKCIAVKRPRGFATAQAGLAGEGR